MECPGLPSVMPRLKLHLLTRQVHILLGLAHFTLLYDNLELLKVIAIPFILGLRVQTAHKPLMPTLQQRHLYIPILRRHNMLHKPQHRIHDPRPHVVLLGLFIFG